MGQDLAQHRLCGLSSMWVPWTCTLDGVWAPFGDKKEKDEKKSERPKLYS